MMHLTPFDTEPRSPAPIEPIQPAEPAWWGWVRAIVLTAGLARCRNEDGRMTFPLSPFDLDEPRSPPRVVGLHETHERRIWRASLAVFPVAVLVYLLVVL